MSTRKDKESQNNNNDNKKRESPPVKIRGREFVSESDVHVNGKPLARREQNNRSRKNFWSEAGTTNTYIVTGGENGKHKWHRIRSRKGYGNSSVLVRNVNFLTVE